MILFSTGCPFCFKWISECPFCHWQARHNGKICCWPIAESRDGPCISWIWIKSVKRMLTLHISSHSQSKNSQIYENPVYSVGPTSKIKSFINVIASTNFLVPEWISLIHFAVVMWLLLVFFLIRWYWQDYNLWSANLICIIKDHWWCWKWNRNKHKIVMMRIMKSSFQSTYGN